MRQLLNPFIKRIPLSHPVSFSPLSLIFALQECQDDKLYHNKSVYKRTLTPHPLYRLLFFPRILHKLNRITPSLRILLGFKIIRTHPKQSQKLIP